MLLLCFSIFKYRLFSFLTYLYSVFLKNISSVIRSFSSGYLNRHSRPLIHETDILNTFNTFKKLLTTFNSSIDFNFILNYDFIFNAICSENLVIPRSILTV